MTAPPNVFPTGMRDGIESTQRFFRGRRRLLTQRAEGERERRRRPRVVERLERQRAVPLAELLPVRARRRAEVRVRRRRKAERALERDLPRGRVEKVRAAHDLRDALSRVVHDDRELVGERTVRALHDEVADGNLEIFGEGTEEKIFEGEEAGGNAEAKGAGGLSGRQPARHVPG